MSYSPSTDFLGLLRQTSGGVRSVRMPGLDYVVDAMARAGLFDLVIQQTAPVVGQLSTAWFKPAVPSYASEGVLYLWNASTNEYEPATPDLWAAMLIPPGPGEVFQSVTTDTATVDANATLVAIERDNPVTTTLTLPSITVRRAASLHIVDWSTNIVAHQINLVPTGTETIMRAGGWPVLSNPAQLGSVTLTPSPNLNAWYIAP